MQLLIFGDSTLGGYDKADVEKSCKEDSVQSSAFRRKHAVVHVLAISCGHTFRIQGYLYLVVCTFGALQPTANVQ